MVKKLKYKLKQQFINNFLCSVKIRSYLQIKKKSHVKGKLIINYLNKNIHKKKSNKQFFHK